MIEPSRVPAVADAMLSVLIGMSLVDYAAMGGSAWDAAFSVRARKGSHPGLALHARALTPD